MATESIAEFNSMLASDCQMSIEEFYKENDWDVYPRPYSVLSDYWDNTESYRIIFPSDNTEMDRPTQYYVASRAISKLKVSRIGIVAYLEIEAPHRNEIPEIFWGRNCRAALIGSASRKSHSHFHDEDSAQYESELMLFDMIDGKLEFSTIADQSIWQDVINNVSLFRDFLFFSAFPTNSAPYRWPEFLQFINAYGFEIDFTGERQKSKFLMSQPAVVGI